LSWTTRLSFKTRMLGKCLGIASLLGENGELSWFAYSVLLRVVLMLTQLRSTGRS
jgi:hypothetical protein